LRHIRERGRWLGWSGACWRRDETGEAERAAKETVRRLLAGSVAIEDDDKRNRATKWALTSQSEPRLRAMAALAARTTDIALAADQLDRDPWLLSCANGTLDLRDGTLRPHDAADLITLGTEVAYLPETPCPRWLQFLTEVFGGDDDLIAFIRRFIGYCLT